MSLTCISLPHQSNVRQQVQPTRVKGELLHLWQNAIPTLGWAAGPVQLMTHLAIQNPGHTVAWLLGVPWPHILSYQVPSTTPKLLPRGVYVSSWMAWPLQKPRGQLCLPHGCLVQLHPTSFTPLTPTAGRWLPHHDEIRCRVLPGPSPTQSWQPSVSPRVWAKQFTQVCVLLLDSKRQTRQYPSFSAVRDAKCSVCLSRWRGHPCSALTLTSSAERGGHCPGLCEGDLAPSAVHVVREGLPRTVTSSSPTPIYVPW